MQTSQVHSEPLLPRVARGEPEALQACLDRYSPLVWTLARRLLGTADGLEDIVQEIFIDLWRSAASFDSQRASETTFVATIARRRVIDRLRGKNRAPRTEPIEDYTSVEEHRGFQDVDIDDEAHGARRALQALVPEQRRLILMSVVDGMTHHEIAASTGLPLGTVKSHIRRGLERAAEWLRSSKQGGAP